LDGKSVAKPPGKTQKQIGFVFTQLAAPKQLPAVGPDIAYI